MASQFESCVSHAYSAQKVALEEPLVRCPACKESRWEGNYEDLIPHFKQRHPLSICWAGDKVRHHNHPMVGFICVVAWVTACDRNTDRETEFFSYLNFFIIKKRSEMTEGDYFGVQRVRLPTLTGER